MEKSGGLAKKIEPIDGYLLKVKSGAVPTFNMSNKRKIDYLKKHRPDLFEWRENSAWGVQLKGN